MLESSHYLRDSTEMADPFSDILMLANAQSVVSGGFTAADPWAIRFPAPDKVKFFGVVKGNCWLRIEGEETPVRVGAGDVFLLSAQRSFVLEGEGRPSRWTQRPCSPATPVPSRSLTRTMTSS
jgi:Cupin